MNIKQHVLKAFAFDSELPKGEIIPIVPGRYYRARAFYKGKEYSARGISHSDCIDILFAKMKPHEAQ